MKWWSKSGFLLTVVMLLLMSACQSTGSSGSAGPVKMVTLGVINPLTGPGAPWGISARAGIEAGIDYINRKGGIKSLGGAMLNPLYFDGQSKPEVAVAQTDTAIDKGAIAMIGSASSPMSLLASEVAERRNVPFISIDAEATLTTRGFKNIFRVLGRSQDLVNATAEFLDYAGKKSGKPIKKIAVYSYDFSPGPEVNKLWQDHAQKYGWQVVDSQLYSETNLKDWIPILTGLKAKEPDVIVGAQSTAAQKLVLALKEMKWNVNYVSSVGGFAVPSIYVPVGKDGNYILAPTFTAQDDPKLQWLEDELFKKSGEHLSMMNGVGFGAVVVFADALERAASLKPEALRDALGKTNLDYLQNDYPVAGGAAFDAQGNNSKIKAFVIQIKDGRERAVYPEAFARSQLVWPEPPWSERAN